MIFFFYSFGVLLTKFSVKRFFCQFYKRKKTPITYGLKYAKDIQIWHGISNEFFLNLDGGM